MLLGLRQPILGGRLLGAARVKGARRGAGTASNAEPARGHRMTVSSRACHHRAMPHDPTVGVDEARGRPHSSSSFFATVCFRMLPTYTSGTSQQGSAGCSIA